MAIRMYDSNKTMDYVHQLLKNRTQEEIDHFRKAVHDLFDKKTVSDEGEYPTFLITKEDADNIYKELYG